MNHMQVSTALKRKVEARIAECKKLTGIDVGKVEVRYDINSARLGGQAIYHGNVVRVNPVFLNAYTDEYIAQTVAHEYAHLAAVHEYGIHEGHGHGHAWKSVMRGMGLDAARCHSFQVPEGVAVGKQRVKHDIHCTKCGHDMTCGPKVERKIARGAEYKHNGCGGVIALGKHVVKAAERPAVKAPKTTAKPTPVMTGSKLDICKRLWIDHNSLPKAKQTRATMIELFIEFAGCTPAGAATYYSKLNKEMA